MANSPSTQPTSPDDMPEWVKGDAPTATDGTTGQPLDVEVISAEEAKAIAAQPSIRNLIEWCHSNVVDDDDTSAAAMEAIVARVLAADDMAAVLSEELPLKAENILRKPFTLLGFRVAETDFSDGFPYYAILDITIGTPPRKQVCTVGAFKIMAQLKRMHDLGEWPQVVMFTTPKTPTKSGKLPLSLVRPD